MRTSIVWIAKMNPGLDVGGIRMRARKVRMILQRLYERSNTTKCRQIANKKNVGLSNAYFYLKKNHRDERNPKIRSFF